MQRNGSFQQNKKIIAADDFYVGCSIVTTSKELFIYPELPNLNKQKTLQQEKTQIWMENMTSWTRLLPAPTEEKLTIAFHNSQGARNKKECYATTNILQSFDILGIAECVEENIFDEISHLSKIAEIQGRNRMGSGLAIYINPNKVQAQVI